MAKKQCFRAVLFRMVPKLLGKRRDYDRCVLELCCFEWFQNSDITALSEIDGFRAVLFRMVPKHVINYLFVNVCFRAVLFRMVPKLWLLNMNTPKPHLVRHWVG